MRCKLVHVCRREVRLQIKQPGSGLACFVETLKVAVMGWVVNGPGESKSADIGISLPGTGEAPRCPVFIDGEMATTIEGTVEEVTASFLDLIDDYVARRYPEKK